MRPDAEEALSAIEGTYAGLKFHDGQITLEGDEANVINALKEAEDYASCAGNLIDDAKVYFNKFMGVIFNGLGERPMKLHIVWDTSQERLWIVLSGMVKSLPVFICVLQGFG